MATGCWASCFWCVLWRYSWSEWHCACTNMIGTFCCTSGIPWVSVTCNQAIVLMTSFYPVKIVLQNSRPTPVVSSCVNGVDEAEPCWGPAVVICDPHYRPCSCRMLALYAKKTDEFLSNIQTKRDYRRCSIICFRETWLDATIPDAAPPGLTIYRSDRSRAESGKARVGHVCFLVIILIIIIKLYCHIQRVKMTW